jgi:hypothetical protein
MAKAFGATSAAVMVVEPDRRQVLSMTENVSTALGTYQAHYWKTDVWVQRGSQSDLGRVLASTDMIADSELEEIEFYQDWLRGQDVFIWWVQSVQSDKEHWVFWASTDRGRSAPIKKMKRNGSLGSCRTYSVRCISATCQY